MPPGVPRLFPTFVRSIHVFVVHTATPPRHFLQMPLRGGCAAPAGGQLHRITLYTPKFTTSTTARGRAPLDVLGGSQQRFGVDLSRVALGPGSGYLLRGTPPAYLLSLVLAQGVSISIGIRRKAGTAAQGYRETIQIARKLEAASRSPGCLR